MTETTIAGMVLVGVIQLVTLLVALYAAIEARSVARTLSEVAGRDV